MHAAGDAPVHQPSDRARSQRKPPGARGLSPGTAASRSSRGLVMLRRALEEEAQPAAGGDIDA